MSVVGVATAATPRPRLLEEAEAAICEAGDPIITNGRRTIGTTVVVLGAVAAAADAAEWLALLLLWLLLARLPVGRRVKKKLVFGATAGGAVSTAVVDVDVCNGGTLNTILSVGGGGGAVEVSSPATAAATAAIAAALVSISE